MRPHPSPASRARFRDWYNNEHGPDRLRKPDIFANGLRYRSCSESDNGDPALFMAIYDVPHAHLLATPAYTALRARRAPREARTMTTDVDEVRRSLYDLVWARSSPLFRPLESLADDEADGIVTVTEQVTPSDDPAAEDSYRAWFVDEHVEALARGPGWLRSRLFKTSTLEQEQQRGPVVFLALHDYAKHNSVVDEKHEAPGIVGRKDVAASQRHTWSLFYILGPGPRDLEAVSLNPDAAPFTSPDGQTCTTPGPGAVISSYMTTSDSLTIPFRLEGNPSPHAPTIAFSNSLLTSLHMWDPFLDVLRLERPDLRILRYDTRGRHSIPQPPRAATLTTLTADLAQLLDALHIPQLHALVGVSMGGATALSFASNHPTRLRKFIACDFNSASTPANTQAWKGRASMVDADAHPGDVDPEDGSEARGIRKLADQTVARWLHPASLDKAQLKKWLTDMVAANDVEGFKHSCTALWDYDLRPAMEGCAVPGLFVVGEADAKGAVAKAMQGFKDMLGHDGAELKVVPNTGHLPMCEHPQAFWESISHFL